MPIETKLSKLEKILDLARKQEATEAEVIQKSVIENPINFENNKLKTLESNESSGISLRVIKNKKIGTASSTDPDALEDIVSAAIEASEFGPEATFELSKENLPTLTDKHTDTETNLEELVEKGTNVIESLKPFHKDLLVSGGFNLSHKETIYMNTNDIAGKRKKTIYSTGFYAHLVRGEDFLGIYEDESSLENFPSEDKIADKILEKLNYSKENFPMETKKYPIIFTPRAVYSIFADILSVVLNGKIIQQEISPLTKSLGTKIFDENFSFTEDPNIGTGRAEFDDEGIKTRKKDLIKNGVVNSFYFDLASASRDMPRHVSTGNGFKGSLATPPSPVLTTLVIESGNTKYKDIVKNIQEGIIIDQLLGAGQSNTLAGEFNVGIDLGFKIKGGKIQGRIKNCMVAGNIFEVLKSISTISSEREWVSSACFFPYFLIENMTVAGK